VEHEMDEEKLLRIQRVVDTRQRRVHGVLARMAGLRMRTIGASECYELEDGRLRLARLRRFHERYRLESRKIAKRGGCPMVFRVPKPKKVN
jgi:hypothetical protein